MAIGKTERCSIAVGTFRSASAVTVDATYSLEEASISELKEFVIRGFKLEVQLRHTIAVGR